MDRLYNLRDVPPTGWRFTERATGERFEATAYSDLAASVRRHREYKGLPTENLDAEIQDQICIQCPDGWCTRAPGSRPVLDLTQKLTTDMAVAANKGILAFVKGGLKFADPETAAARAAICQTCPFNKPASGCSCNAVYRVIEAFIPSGRKHKNLGICMACGCSLQAKVNMPEDVVSASITPGTVFPPWCWQQPLAT